MLTMEPLRFLSGHLVLQNCVRSEILWIV